MSSAFFYKDQFFYVSNAMFSALIDWGLEVGTTEAKSEKERHYVETLRQKTETFFPGYDLIIEEDFSELDERKFWARIFFDLAYMIFQRKIGPPDVDFWMYSAIGNAYLLGRMITRSVQEQELAWHPETQAKLDAEIFSKRGLNVRL